MEIRKVLAELEAEAARDYVPILRGAERELLLTAAEEARPRRILEIGTAIGFSALLLSERLPGADITTIELDPLRRAIAARAVGEAGREDRIQCVLGDAGKVIPALQGPYDFLYLDGPKGQYLRHLQAAEPLLSPEAVVAADNVLFRGLVEGEGPVPHRYRTLVVRLREYLAYVEARYDTTVYPEGDGLAISRPKVLTSAECREF